jgi:pyruvate/2-oxoglutarate dehydrogenase complex dihydrolipoamide acyltransferase (E2) component
VNVRAALVPALVAVLLTGCAAGQEHEEPAAAATPTPAPASSSPSTAPSAAQSPTAAAAPSPTPSARTVAVSYVGGEVTGTSGREEVSVGEQVVLRVSSDVAEEVHVHGYDLEGAIPAGGSVDIPLTASIPGVFEVELHDSGRVLFQLRVA